MENKYDSKRLAIITLYEDLNFGNKLQNYASQRYFEKMGFIVNTLPNINHFLFWPSVKICIHLAMQLIGIEKSPAAKQLRRIYIKSFSDQYLHVYKPCHRLCYIQQLKKEFDLFVTGSDQVWHYSGKSKSALKYYLLYFVKSSKKITIAPSFSFDQMPHAYEKIYRRGLADFKYLSIREERGAELIKELTGKEATVLLDPTMLIDTSEWLKILKKPAQYIDEKYVFVYTLGGFKGEVKEKTCKLANDLGFKVVDIMDIDSDYYIHTRPDEFLYWINNARLVVTDSFHATVFSILFNRPFVVTERSDIKGMGSRLNTLFNKLGITDRYFDELKDGFDRASENRNKLFEVNYSCVQETLETERKKAEMFFKMCLSERG